MSDRGAFEPQRPIQLPRRHRLRWQLVSFFVLLATIPQIIAMGLALDQMRRQTERQLISQLESVAELKHDQISEWIGDEVQFLDIAMADSRRRTQLVEALLPGDANPAVRAELNVYFADLISGSLREQAPTQVQNHLLQLYDPSGRVLAASDPAQIGKSVANQPYFARSLSDAAIHPPHYAIATSQLTIVATRQIRQAQGALLGVLAVQLVPDELGAIMAKRDGMGETGETYMVSSENNYLLTPSRFAGYALNQAYHSLGIDRGLAGQNGADVYINYRGVPVIGVYRWVPELQAALLAEIDAAEAFQPFNATMRLSVLLTALVVTIAVALGILVAARLTRPIMDLTQAATRIAAGSLDSPIVAGQRNEIGLLAGAFRQMTERLRATLAGLERRVAERTADLERSKRATEQALAELRESIEQRELLNATVRELASPVLPIMRGVLLMPLIGAVDVERASLLTEALLQGIERHSSRVAILDVTGVPIIDTPVARVLLQASSAARLLGARPVLVGIRPELAQTIVGLGINLADLATCADLQEGLRYAAALIERR